MMTAEEQLKIFREHVLTALKEIPHSRWYALDETALDSLAFLGISWLEQRVEDGLRFNAEEFRKVVAELVELTPSLRQERPEQPPPTPEVWKDGVTGQVARNPFSDPPDLESQGAITKADPALAEHLKATAEGVTYKFLNAQREKEARRARISAISYSQAEHETNPFRGSDLQAQAQLAREDLERAAVFKREAEPVRVPWQIGAKNMTSMARITAKNPHIAKLANRANELERQRIAEQKAAALQAKVEAEAKLRAADQMLQSK